MTPKGVRGVCVSAIVVSAVSLLALIGSRVGEPVSPPVPVSVPVAPVEDPLPVPVPSEGPLASTDGTVPPHVVSERDRVACLRALFLLATSGERWGFGLGVCSLMPAVDVGGLVKVLVGELLAGDLPSVSPSPSGVDS